MGSAIDTLQETTSDLFADRWLDADIYRLRRAAQDLYARSMHSGAYYALASIVFVLTLDEPAHLPLIAWLPTLSFLLISVLRVLNKVPTEECEPTAYRRWRRRHWLLIDASCLIWGGHMLKAGMIGIPYSLTMMVGLSTMFVGGSVISQSFCMNRRNAMASLCCLFLPGIVAFALCSPESGLPAAGVTLIVGIMVTVMLLRSAKDYDRKIAIEHELILSRAETERLVRTDSLTGLANRRDYERRFAQAWHMAARQKSNLALLVLDLDNFKRLNDTYGHAAGDSCLRHFGNLLMTHFRRAGDVLARIGGEEFAVILPGMSATDAAKMGEDFRQTLVNSHCQYVDQAIQVTVSIGVGAVDWTLDGAPATTFARIDHACYGAKKQGRNRVVMV